MRELNVKLPPLPPSLRSNHTDLIHGTKVADPFRILECDDHAEVRAWIEAQRVRTRTVLDSLPLRAEIEALLHSIWDYPREGLPIQRGNYSFFGHYDGIAAQRTLHVEEGGQFRILLDANLWSDDGSASLGDYWPSPDGAFVAYTRHLSGSDWSSIHIANTKTGDELPDVIVNCRWGGVAWLPDAKSFLYTLPPAEEPNRETVRIHTLGQPVKRDRTVFVTPQPAPSFVSCVEFANGQGAACYASEGAGNENGCWIVEKDGTTFRPLVPVGFAKFEACHRDGEVIYAITTHRAPFGRLVAVSLGDPSPESWRDIVPEGEGSLNQAALVNSRWILRYTTHGWDHIESRAVNGADRQVITLPELGFAFLGQANPTEKTIFVSHRTLKRPALDYRLDPLQGKLTLFREPQARADLADCVVKQVFVVARDGARIPLTLIHRSDFQRHGVTPTLLYSYGGYGLLSEHGFSHSTYCWVKAGGVYAIAGIRGGGEEGENWHKAAIKANRQVSFNDFIDCSEWLIANRYCSKKTMGIQGGSNGGLLVAACLTQRPDLFGGVLCDVPTLDMLRFHLFTVGAGWIPEYGSPDDPEDFKHLLAYSPVHNVAEDVAYPPIMISTADHDDRSVPMHSFKFAAALQETLSPIVFL